MTSERPGIPGFGQLVNATVLASHVRMPGWRVVDCRFDIARPGAGEAAYREGHVPGAVYAHLDRHLSSPITPVSGRHPLPDPVRLSRQLGAWGIGPDTNVVAYDAASGAIAARFWWLLRWLGHRRVALLDGGYPAWQAAGLPVSAEIPALAPAAFRGVPGQMPVAETAEIARRLGDPSLMLVDVRAGARFAGRDEPVDPVAGHVPGAVNHPFVADLDHDGCFLTPSRIAAGVAALRAPAARGDLVVMCGSGVTACHKIFALELAGLDGARLYAGSWSEWIRSGQRPVARGDGVA